MNWYLRSKSRALPILNRKTFSLRSIISVLFTVSEPPTWGTITAKAALDKLSDADLERYTEPEQFTSASAAATYMASRKAQSSECIWRKQDDGLSLLARSKFAKSLGVPGVVFEFMVRTGASTWTVYQMPEPSNIFNSRVHLARNELMTCSNRPDKLSICPKQKPSHGRLYNRLGRTLSKIAATLFGWLNPA